MNWRDEWVAIAARIDGVLGAGQFYVRAMTINSQDPYKVHSRVLIPEAIAIIEELKLFRGKFQKVVCVRATESLDRFLSRVGPKEDQRPLTGTDGCFYYLTSLASIRSELQYHFSDFQSIAHKKTEKAFCHLKQTIVADNAVADSWRNAFDQGETYCENLGAAHLLLHGIWGFKVSAPGARTDLIFNDSQDIENIADVLVLTEWKKVTDKQNAEIIAAGARNQCKHYSDGLLTGITLSQYRYIVLVSRDHLPRFDDVVEDTVSYRHINIPVRPSTPARASKIQT